MHTKTLLLIAAVSLIGIKAQATTINLGTDGIAGQTGNIGGYKVTAAGAVNATPYNSAVRTLALSSDGSSSGTPVAGATPAAFDGFANFSTVFNLPTNATGATLNYTNLAANDRFTLELNGNILAQSGIFAPTTPTAGTFVYTSGGSEAPAIYQSTDTTDVNGTVTGSDKSYFNVGGANTLTVLVNATYNGYHNDSTPDGLYHGDFKDTGFSADAITVNYGGAVPEPASWALMLIGVGAAGAALRSPRLRRTAA